MPTFKMQRFRDGWAIAEYRDGKRISRRQLGARDPAGAAAEFQRIVQAATKPVSPTVTALWHLYRQDREGRTIAGNMVWSGKPVLAFFGALEPDDISIHLCRAYAKQRALQGRQTGTVGTELNHLRIVLRWAAKNRLIGPPPYIELPPRSLPRDVRLTRDEFDRLWAAAETHHIRLFLLLAISTAGRVSALLGLKWAQVDLDAGMIDLVDRTGVVRPMKARAQVPITPTLHEALVEAKPGARTPFVIEWAGRQVSSVRTGLERAAERAGIKHISPHVLRHSAASWMAEDGVPMAEIARFLGHTDSSVTERVYARMSPTHLRKAAASLDVGSARRPK